MRYLLVLVILLMASCKKDDPSPMLQQQWITRGDCIVEITGEVEGRTICCEEGAKLIEVEFVLGTDTVILKCK